MLYKDFLSAVSGLKTGDFVRCSIEGTVIKDAKLSFEDDTFIYQNRKVFICQNIKNGDTAKDLQGYKFSWIINGNYSAETIDFIKPLLKTFDQRISYLEELAGVKKEEVEEPKLGTPYWIINEIGECFESRWFNDNSDKARLKVDNCFWKEEGCDNEILRRESMANRIAEPKVGETIFRWDFEVSTVIPCNYTRALYPDWLLGAVYLTNRACKKWGKKYAKAFTNLKS